MRKSQIALEFILILLFVFVIVSLLLYAIGIFSLDFSEDFHKKERDDFAKSILLEANLLQKVEEGYYRKVKIEKNLMERFNVSFVPSYLVLQDFETTLGEDVFYYEILGNYSLRLSFEDLDGDGVNETYLIIEKVFENGFEGLILEEIERVVGFLPTITLLEPNGVDDFANLDYTIRWIDNDLDGSATISLYYDIDSSGQDGVLIVSGIRGSGSVGEYVWDTTSVPEGSYYVYAVINDGGNENIDYSDGKVAVGRVSFLDSWNYARKILINNENNGETLSDYQVLVIVDTQTLISEGKMKSDGSDIRFTDNFSSWMDYWIEEGIGGESGINKVNTKIWVKVPEVLASSSKLIYMLYDNLDANVMSDLSSTFVFGDDFDDDSFNSSKWDVSLGAGGAINEQNNRLEHNSPRGGNSYLFSRESFNGPFVLETRFKKGGYVYRFVDVADDSDENSAIMFLDDWGPIYFQVKKDGVLNSIAVEDNFWSRSVNPEYYIRIFRNPDGTFTINSSVPSFEEGGPKSWEQTFSEIVPISIPLKIRVMESIWFAAWSLLDRYEDDIRIRKYTLPEPTTNVAPRVLVTEPNGVDDFANLDYTIKWVDHDLDSSATISLYYDVDEGGRDGVLIVSGINEDSPVDGYVWDTTSVPDGSYYVYAVIDDGVSDVFVDYSDGKVVVDHVSFLSLDYVFPTPDVGGMSGRNLEFNVSSNVDVVNCTLFWDIGKAGDSYFMDVYEDGCFYLLEDVSDDSYRYYVEGFLNDSGRIEKKVLDERGVEVNHSVVRNCFDLQDMNEDLGGDYLLFNDVDCSMSSSWDAGQGFLPVGNQISYFMGSLNGSGFNVSDLFISRSGQYVGLFGSLEGAEVFDFSLVNVSVLGSGLVGAVAGYESNGSEIVDVRVIGGEVRGSNWVGGMVGYQYNSTINNSYFSGLAEVGFSYGGGLTSYQNRGVIEGSVSGGNVVGLTSFHVGGIVGYQYGGSVISKSYSSSNVSSLFVNSQYTGGISGYQFFNSVIRDSYSSGNVMGSRFVGGIIGQSYSSGVSIVNSYFSGTVSGTSDLGGILSNQGGGSSSSNCYWDSERTGLITSAGDTALQGRTTAQMMTQANYVGWDFANVWSIDEGVGYPVLR